MLNVKKLSNEQIIINMKIEPIKTLLPSSPKVSDQIYVAISVYLTPKNYSEYPTTITFPVGELVFKATITDRTNNQTTYTQFTEGIRGQIKFLG